MPGARGSLHLGKVLTRVWVPRVPLVYQMRAPLGIFMSLKGDQTYRISWPPLLQGLFLSNTLNERGSQSGSNQAFSKFAGRPEPEIVDAHAIALFLFAQLYVRQAQRPDAMEVWPTNSGLPVSSEEAAIHAAVASPSGLHEHAMPNSPARSTSSNSSQGSGRHHHSSHSSTLRSLLCKIDAEPVLETFLELHCMRDKQRLIWPALRPSKEDQIIELCMKTTAWRAKAHSLTILVLHISKASSSFGNIITCHLYLLFR